MVLGVWQATIQDAAGNALALATVTVRKEDDGLLATIFEDRDGLVAKANPFNADANGGVKFYAAGDDYQITAVSGSASITRRNVPIGLLRENDTISDDNWLGTDLAVANGGTGASDAATARTNLGLGTIATQNTINDDDWSGTDLAVVNGGTGASTAAGARTNLGLGSLATQNTINNDDWSGTDLAVANGGTGASTAAGARTNLGLVIGTDVQAFDADTLKADTPDTLTAGFAHTVDNDGTQSSGTYTPDQDGGNMKRIVNGGAFTLAPPTDDCVIIVQITNNGSAGTITTSGFSAVTGDSFTTTNGDDFVCSITKINGFSVLNVVDVS